MAFSLYSLSSDFEADIKSIKAKLDQLLTLVTQEGQIMAASISDLDTALAQVDANLSTVAQVVQSLDDLSTQLVSDVQALAAKVNPDLSTEVQKVLDQASALSNLTTAVNTALQNVQTADETATTT